MIAKLFFSYFAVFSLVVGMSTAYSQDGDTESLLETSETEGFTPVRFSDDVTASFLCTRADGGTIIEIKDVATILPDRIRGIMTFSITDRNGAVQIVYLGANSDCTLKANN